MDPVIPVKYGSARTGRIIDSIFVDLISECSLEEVFDAYAVFSYLVIRELRRFGETEEYERLERLFKRCWSIINQSNKRLLLMEELGLKTVFDLRHYGKSLAFIEFRDR